MLTIIIVTITTRNIYTLARNDVAKSLLVY